MSRARRRCAPSTWDLPFLFDSLHHEFAEQARRVAMKTLAAEESAWERSGPHTEAQNFARTRHLARTLAEARLLEACVPAQYGGLVGAHPETIDVRAVCVAREALAWASGAADTVLAMQGLGSYPIVYAGTEAQKREFLPDVVRGTALAAFAITEPEAGSDPGALESRARRDGETYVLDGVKTFISNAGVAGHYVVFATVDPSAGKKGITAFIVRPEDPGFVYEGALPLNADHAVGTIRFDGLRVPASRRVGAEGEGYKIAMATLDVFRSTVGAAALGMARRALDEALTRVTTRRQFGQTLGEFQTTQVYLAEMATELDAARLLVYRAAYVRDHGAARVTVEAAMAKMYATEAAQRVVDRALQLHGGTGVLRGTAVERLYREVRALRIYEGTTEIQRLVIAGQLLAGERARAEEDKVSAEERAALGSEDTFTDLPHRDGPTLPRTAPPPAPARASADTIAPPKAAPEPSRPARSHGARPDPDATRRLRPQSPKKT